MQTLIITGGTGVLGSVVVPRLEREYRCVLLRRGDDANAVIAKAAPIYGLVHLAGGFAMASVADSDEAAWTNMLTTNVMTFVNAARAAIPHLQPGGRIVAISSRATLEKPPGVPLENVAEAIAWLLSAAAANITGALIPMNA